MPKIRPLTPEQAKRTLAARFTKFDRLRQMNTRFGTRPYRVFLVWTKWSGDERGDGEETVMKTEEILPTPLVSSLDAVTFGPNSAGTLPVGSLKVSEISAGRFTADWLTGKMYPTPHADVPQPYDFFYEVVEDGRADSPPVRQKYRLLSQPFLNSENIEWVIRLERVSEDRHRDGGT